MDYELVRDQVKNVIKPSLFTIWKFLKPSFHGLQAWFLGRKFDSVTAKS